MNLWNIHRGPDTDKTFKLLQERAKESKKVAPKGRRAKKVAAAKRRKADAKRMITMAEKRLAKIGGTNASDNAVTDGQPQIFKCHISGHYNSSLFESAPSFRALIY